MSNNSFVKLKCCLVSWFDYVDYTVENCVFLMSDYEKAVALYNELLSAGYDDVCIDVDLWYDVLVDGCVDASKHEDGSLKNWRACYYE